MSWVDENKGAGPWAFTEQPDKWGYLGNLRWSSQQDAIDFCEAKGLSLDLPNQHLPCGHWHKAMTSGQSIPTGRWVAAMQQPNTPYIYLYDVTYKAVIKIDTSTDPVTLAEVFPINATYQLDSNYDVTQRGGFCMNKDGTRIWYLFREDCIEGGGPKNDCELIEVDISGFLMKKVKSTIYPNLVDCDYYVFHEQINDGCSNDTYTFWATSEVTGRILKIRNSDHVIVEDHLFNYPAYPDTQEPIYTLDVDKNNNKLYWSYVFSKVGYNACQKIIKGNLDFSIDVELDSCGIGMSTPKWQNMIRVYGGYFYHHRNYYPNHGRLTKRELSDCTELAYFDQEYLRNIFGIKNDKLFILMHSNAIHIDYNLRCHKVSDLSLVSEKRVNYYCGKEYLVHFDWHVTAVSAMNQQTDVVVIVRYHDVELRNYVACFKADSSFDLICDEPMNYLVTSNKEIIDDEPQIWTMPG